MSLAAAAAVQGTPTCPLKNEEKDGTNDTDNSIDNIRDGGAVVFTRWRMLQLSQQHEAIPHSYHAGSSLRAARQQHYYQHHDAIR